MPVVLKPLFKNNRTRFELGGQAGAFSCQSLGMAVSSSTLIRYIRKSPPAQDFPTQHRHVGVDDWAIRKGQT